MPTDLIDGKSTLVQVMAWCRQATSHYLSQFWPRSLSPYGIIRPQWVKCQMALSYQSDDQLEVQAWKVVAEMIKYIYTHLSWHSIAVSIGMQNRSVWIIIGGIIFWNSLYKDHQAYSSLSHNPRTRMMVCSLSFKLDLLSLMNLYNSVNVGAPDLLSLSFPISAGTLSCLHLHAEQVCESHHRWGALDDLWKFCIPVFAIRYSTLQQ